MINRLTLPDIATATLDIFLPRTCLVCGEKLPARERHICLGCLADLPRTHYSKMPGNRMSERLNSMIQRDYEARNPMGEPPGYSLATSLFFYRPGTGYRNITRALKYKGDIAAGRCFARMLAEEMKESPLYGDVDAIVPVPLHWTRRWSRGYNQAEVIGEVVAEVLGAEIRPDAIRRGRRTKTQTKMAIEEKAANVSGAFRPGRNASLAGKKHVLVVDDVFTTGATANACVSALREITGPGTRISVATLACVGG